MSKIRNILGHWLPLAVITAAFSALGYLIPQQVLRQSANDPQIQMAQDTAAALARGENITALLPTAQVEMSSSLAPFFIIFDETGKVVASSGVLHGQLPSVPEGVLENARQNGENRVTWQPESGVRIASVIVPINGSTNGFVLAGRSLREVEDRVTKITQIAGAALVATWIATLAAVAFCELVFSAGEKRMS